MTGGYTGYRGSRKGYREAAPACGGHRRLPERDDT